MLKRLLGHSLDEFTALPPARRAELASDSVADLHDFLPGEVAGEPLPVAPVSVDRQRAARLAERLAQAVAKSGASPDGLRSRLVTDAVLREECAHDQNVYFSRFFTHRLTRAVPDVVFQPQSGAEVAAALLWARSEKVPATIRGAASTAMGGAVPGSGGLLLDTARLDGIDVDAAGRRVAFGAGVRMRSLHAKLAEHGQALPVYPSNLGGTYVGWLATGGIGMNAYGRGRALDHVLAAELVLPGGEHVRLDREGGLELVHDGAREPALKSRVAWFQSKGYPALELRDLAGTEGQLGVVVRLEVGLEPLRPMPAFLLAFRRAEDAHAAVDWIAAEVAVGLPAPADVKLLSASHLHHTEAVWAEEDAKGWRERPGAFAEGRGMPWTRIVPPSEVGARTATEPEEPRAFVFVDFLGGEGGRAFARRLADCPGSPGLDDERSVRFAGDRFRPQQVKRLGPGFLGAEVLLPSRHVRSFLPAAAEVAAGARVELDAEVYYLQGGKALAIGGFAADHRTGSFQLALMVVPALLDLAERRFEGRPYVIGRWMAPLVAVKHGASEVERLRGIKRALDPERIVGRGAFFEMGLRTPLGRLTERLVKPSGWIFRTLFRIGPATRLARWVFDRFGGPGAGRGFTARERPLGGASYTAIEPSTATGRAIACVNCGECNSVCPIFNESKIRLPQMLTHLGERLHGGEVPNASGEALLDLCMRCGNCEEVCQAGIPHLPLYETLHRATEPGGRSAEGGGTDSAPPDGVAEAPARRERHILLLERLRASRRYTGRFLDVRPGGYVKRAPAALPGSARFVLLRAENEDGPAATCIHCAACVDVCPTGANREYEGADPRWITTEQKRCIGCGTCVEVCPANRVNDGQTLRVMEAPTPDWLDAAREFAATSSGGPR